MFTTAFRFYIRWLLGVLPDGAVAWLRHVTCLVMHVISQHETQKLMYQNRLIKHAGL